MDFGKLVKDVIAAGQTATALIPGLSTVTAAVAIGEKLIDLIDSVTDEAPVDDQKDLAVVRAELRAAVSAKAEQTADRLEG